MIIRLFFIFLFIYSQTAMAQLTIQVNKIPVNTPAIASIYLAGNFQGWNPGNPNYQLLQKADGIFEITIEPTVGDLEFKFTRGSWEQTEGNANGNYLPNRTFQYSGDSTTITLEIASWEDIEGINNSTAATNVRILDHDFPISTLNRERRIWIYLPPDYETTDKKYPVLYLQDGQNVFDASTSFSGEWRVDESLNQLFQQGDHGCIVVAIDNGQAHRINEYSPWVNNQYGGGEGDEYMNFIVNELKPVIDANFRTFRERKFTGIMGSSLGGLISHFGFVEYQAVFGKAGIFSPSYWFSNGVYEHTADIEKVADTKIYLLGGQNESASLVPDINRMEDLLHAEGFDNDEIQKAIHADGAHSEWYWAREFPTAYKWLFDGLDFTTSTKTLPTSIIQIYPNPIDSVLHFKGVKQMTEPLLEIVSLQGQSIQKIPLTQTTINLSTLLNGFYIVKIWENNRVVFSEKIVKE